MSTLHQLSQAVKDAAPDLNNDLVNSATEQLCDWLHAHPEQINEIDLTVLKTLKEFRQFAALRHLSETLNGLGHTDPQVRLDLGQSLIDSGSPSTAIDILRRVLDKKELPSEAKIEANGLIGRAFKDLFIRTGSTDTERRKELLSLAVENYATAYNDSGQKNFWTGENALALLTKAKLLGVEIDDTFDARTISDQIVSAIEETPENKRRYWHWASLAIVEIARGNWDAASQKVSEALSQTDVTAFKLAGTIRQLKEFWDFDDPKSEGAGIIASLQARLLQLSHGQVQMSAEDIALARAIPEDQFEKIFGSEGPKTYRWMQKFLDRGESVALISKNLGDGVGTGFIVKGEDFHPSLKGERLILTNDHVVSPKPELYQSSPPLLIDQVEVTFELFSTKKGECRIAAKEIVWSSGAQDHDACLIRLESEIPDELVPLPITHRAPIVDKKSPQGVYIIGHPGGRKLSYSMQNNELLDHDCKGADDDAVPRRIHYVTPTEPGSSGSPAMNAELDVVGLHHAGAKYMSKLNGQDGTYPANEAVWIQSICRAARNDLDEKRKRWKA